MSVNENNESGENQVLQIREKRSTSSLQYDQQYYGNGKLLISGEYFLIDGAKGLALPTILGQSLNVKYTPSFDPKLHWRSYDVEGNCWFESTFEFWHFECLDDSPCERARFLQKVLLQARRQNKHFLRDGVNIEVETFLSFSREWGLGSSSTLIYNIAQWAYISPFELLFHTLGGSGYDIACAQSEGPISYRKNMGTPHWSPIKFNPIFKNKIYFLYLMKKKNTSDAISYFYKKSPFKKGVKDEISALTDEMISSVSLEHFDSLMDRHEDLISKNLDLERVKDKFFSDFWGGIKSLGAWGGDFAMVTSRKSFEETADYFKSKGFRILIPYEDIILENKESAFTSSMYHHEFIQ